MAMEELTPDSINEALHELVEMGLVREIDTTAYGSLREAVCNDPCIDGVFLYVVQSDHDNHDVWVTTFIWAPDTDKAIEWALKDALIMDVAIDERYLFRATHPPTSGKKSETRVHYDGVEAWECCPDTNDGDYTLYVVSMGSSEVGSTRYYV